MKTAAQTVKISNPDKVFWPEEGYTKNDLAEFYRSVFPKLKPFVEDRILTLERCPDGMQGQCFYQKEAPKGLPAGTITKAVAREGKGGSTNYVVGGTLETQLALVNLGCIPVHVIGSRAAKFKQPDWVCFDIDPASGKFSDAAAAGLVVKEVLDELKLQSFPKTSGSRGLHIFIPIKLGPSADDVLHFAEALVNRIAADHPSTMTVEHSIAARGERVYLDPFRNGAVQTVVAPYSVRRRPGAPVSTPLAWREVKASLRPESFNIGNFKKRMQRADPWSEFFKSRQNLAPVIARLRKL